MGQWGKRLWLLDINALAARYWHPVSGSPLPASLMRVAYFTAYETPIENKYCGKIKSQKETNGIFCYFADGLNGPAAGQHAGCRAG